MVVTFWLIVNILIVNSLISSQAFAIKKKTRLFFKFQIRIWEENEARCRSTWNWNRRANTQMTTKGRFWSIFFKARWRQIIFSFASIWAFDRKILKKQKLWLFQNYFWCYWIRSTVITESTKRRTRFWWICWLLYAVNRYIKIKIVNRYSFVNYNKASI